MKEVDVLPDVKEDECGYGEDDTCGDAFAGARTHGGDINFEDGGFEWFEQGKCHDRTRYDGADGHAGVEAEVGVGCAEYDGKKDADEDCFEGEFWYDCLAGDVGFEVFSCGHKWFHVYYYFMIIKIYVSGLKGRGLLILAINIK